jgi:hypothetical protein
MKLPLQAAAVIRTGQSWPARRSSVQGISLSRPRKDVNVCVHDSQNPKCGGDMGVVTCASGACQCCAPGAIASEAPGGRCNCG